MENRRLPSGKAYRRAYVPVRRTCLIQLMNRLAGSLLWRVRGIRGH
jgi:hypothetical protein